MKLALGLGISGLSFGASVSITIDGLTTTAFAAHVLLGTHGSVVVNIDGVPATTVAWNDQADMLGTSYNGTGNALADVTALDTGDPNSPGVVYYDADGYTGSLTIRDAAPAFSTQPTVPATVVVGNSWVVTPGTHAGTGTYTQQLATLTLDGADRLDIETPGMAWNTSGESAYGNDGVIAATVALIGSGGTAISNALAATLIDVPGQMGAPTVTATGPTSVSYTLGASGDDGNSAVTSQSIQYSVNGGVDWTPQSHTGTISGLPAATEIRVQTRDINAAGNGAWSTSGIDTTDAATVTLDPITFTPGGSGSPATLDLTVTYAGAETLTAHIVTSNSATPPSAAQILAGSGGNILEKITQGVSAGSATLGTTFTGASSGATHIYVLVDEDAGAEASSNIEGDTTGTLDVTVPAIVPASCTPVDGGTGADLTSDLTAIFSETVFAGTGNFYLRNVSDATTDDTVAIGSCTIGTTDVVIPFADRIASKNYAVRWDVGVVVDSWGNDVAANTGDTLWNFAAPAADSTAPVLTLPTGARNHSVGAKTLGVTTDEGNGTLYWGIYPTASTPTAADVVAGTGATLSGSQAVSGTGVQAVADQIGLTAGQAYKAHYVHDDAATNRSNLATSSEFTTTAALAFNSEFDQSNNLSATQTQTSTSVIPSGTWVLACVNNCTDNNVVLTPTGPNITSAPLIQNTVGLTAHGSQNITAWLVTASATSNLTIENTGTGTSNYRRFYLINAAGRTNTGAITDRNKAVDAGSIALPGVSVTAGFGVAVIVGDRLGTVTGLIFSNATEVADGQLSSSSHRAGCALKTQTTTATYNETVTLTGHDGTSSSVLLMVALPGT